MRMLLKRIFYGFFYYQESRKNYFPCKLTGNYYFDPDGKTVVEVKNFGNAKHFHIHVKSIFEDRHFLDKFAASDVSIITMSAYNEIFFSIEHSTREQSMNKIIKSSFDQIKEQNNKEQL